jgi:hypothetical protein
MGRAHHGRFESELVEQTRLIPILPPYIAEPPATLDQQESLFAEALKLLFDRIGHAQTIPLPRRRRPMMSGAPSMAVAPRPVTNAGSKVP